MSARRWGLVLVMAACAKPAQTTSLQRWSARFSRLVGGQRQAAFSQPLATAWQRRADGGWAVQGTASGLGALAVSLPGRADGALRVEAPGVWLESRLVGARPVAGEVTGGRLVYPAAREGVDRIFEVAMDRAEELLGLEGERAALGLAYELVTCDAIADVRQDGSGRGLVAVDAQGGARLKSPAPSGVDADGRRVEATLTVKATAPHRFTVALTLQGTPRFPVLLDPSWVSPEAVGIPRKLHTATLLTTGEVLLTGGLDATDTATDSAALYDPSTGTFTATGSMPSPRAQHTATLLGDDTVLVAGGIDGEAAFPTGLAIYDRAQGHFRAVAGAALASGRIYHTATRLNDGSVLLVGGLDGNSGVVDNAERYLPASGQVDANRYFLQVARYGHTATLLSNGRVFIAGGEGDPAQPAPRTCEAYSPGLPGFVPEGLLQVGRHDHTATRLPGDQVLLVGGYAGTTLLASAERIGLGGADGVPTAGAPRGRGTHTATPLPSGLVLLAGGVAANGDQPEETQLYDPATDTFAEGPALPVGRTDHTATLLATGRVLLAGGLGHGAAEPGKVDLLESSQPSLRPSQGHLHTALTGQVATVLPGGKVLLTGGEAGGVPQGRAELYDPVRDTFQVTGAMQSARSHHTATLLPTGLVLLVGGAAPLGQAGVGPTASAELYNPGTGRFTAAGALQAARHRHTATLLPDGAVLIAGGTGLGDAVLRSAEVYQQGSFTALGAPMTAPRSGHTATLLVGGQVLLAGGFEAVAPAASASAERFEPSTRTFHGEAPMTQPRANHTATLLHSGQVLLVGGAAATAERYDPALHRFMAVGPLQAARPSGHTATLLQDGKVLVAGGAGALDRAEWYDPDLQRFSAAGSLHEGRGGHAAARLPDGEVLLVGGQGQAGELPSAERFDRGLAASDGGAAVIEVTGRSGAGVLLRGEGVLGRSEASGGTPSSSASNHPVALLEREDNGQRVLSAAVDTSGVWSAVSPSLAVQVPADAPGGFYRLALVTNGVPSNTVTVRAGAACSGPGDCDDGNACDGLDHCQGDACVGLGFGGCPAPDECHAAPVVCTPDHGCDTDPLSGVPCDGGLCDEGYCTPQPSSSGSTGSTHPTGLPGDAFGCQSTGPGLEWLALAALGLRRRRRGLQAAGAALALLAAPQARADEHRIEVSARAGTELSAPAQGGSGAVTAGYRLVPELSLSIGATMVGLGHHWGGLLRADWTPVFVDKAVHPVAGLEVQGLALAEASVAVAPSLGIEVVPVDFLALRLEVPVLFLVKAPAGLRTVYEFAQVSVGARF